MQAFFSWVNKDPGELGKSDITGYRDYLREKGYKDSTVWNKFIALNRFLKYLEGENRKFHNPISFKELKLIFPKKDRGYYTVLAKPEAEKLLQQPSRKDDIGKRDLAILLLMLVYGLRANEITKLRFGNLEPERVKGQQKVWIVDRKGKYQNRPETPIILNGRTLKAFDEWLQVVKASGIKPKEETPIFLPFIYDQDAQESHHQAEAGPYPAHGQGRRERRGPPHQEGEDQTGREDPERPCPPSHRLHPPCPGRASDRGDTEARRPPGHQHDDDLRPLCSELRGSPGHAQPPEPVMKIGGGKEVRCKV